MPRYKNKNKKTYRKQKQHRKRRFSRRKPMSGGSILSDLTSNFQTLKSTFTNNITNQVTTNLSALKAKALLRYNNAKDVVTRKINCFKN